MIKNIKYKILLLVLVFSASSCNKWLELKPEDGIIRQDFWKTKEQLKSAVIGCYSSLTTVPSGKSGLIQNLLVWGELRADMMTNGTVITTNERDYANNEILPSNSLSNWSPLYNTINVCNTVIQYGPQVIDNDKTLSQAQLNAYLAEARGLRALMYFYLLRLWGEVPLQLKASSTDSQIEQIAKSSKEEVYNQILADLDFAALYAPETYGDPDMDKGRITVYAINALQADVYLWGERYEDCIAACKKVEDSGKFGLIDATDPAQWFRDLYVNGNSVEGIFEIQFDRQTQNPWYSLLAASPYRYAATPIMDDFYGIADVSNPLAKDIRGNGAAYNAGSGGTLWKHIGTTYGGTTTVNTTNSDRNWIVYRYADIYLMHAEALAWTNKGAEALTYVKKIRDRAHALSITEDPVSPSSPYEVSDYILKERAREFAFEGKRWFDLLRHAKRNNYERKAQVIIDAISKVAPTDKLEAITNKFKDYRNHYLPIATSELQADKKLEQNSFYKTN